MYLYSKKPVLMVSGTQGWSDGTATSHAGKQLQNWWPQSSTTCAFHPSHQEYNAAVSYALMKLFPVITLDSFETSMTYKVVKAVHGNKSDNQCNCNWSDTQLSMLLPHMHARACTHTHTHTHTLCVIYKIIIEKQSNKITASTTDCLLIFPPSSQS